MQTNPQQVDRPVHQRDEAGLVERRLHQTGIVLGQDKEVSGQFAGERLHFRPC